MGTFTTIPREATKGSGGIDYVLIANYADVSTSIDNSTGLVSMDPSTATAWTKFVPRKESSNYAETLAVNVPGGNTSFNQVLTLVFGYNQTAKRNQMKILSQSEVKAVVVDRNNIGWLMGNRNGLDAAGSRTSGTMDADPNTMTFTLSGNEPEPFAEVPGWLLDIIKG